MTVLVSAIAQSGPEFCVKLILIDFKKIIEQQY